jgi:C4-type Zn-finger protein
MNKCNNCGSNNITKIPHQNTRYGGVVINFTYICEDCGCESRETKAYGRGNQLKDKLKKDTDGKF